VETFPTSNARQRQKKKSKQNRSQLSLPHFLLHRKMMPKKRKRQQQAKMRRLDIV
jgi:hypothetical protein